MTKLSRPTSMGQTSRNGLRNVLLSGTAMMLACGSAAYAQETQTKKVQHLGEMVLGYNLTSSADDAASVVAAGSTGGSKLATPLRDLPASVSVITSKEIADRGATNIEEVLQYTPGVLVDQWGSDDRFDSYMIRGYDATGSRDNLSLGSAFGGVREEPYAFERIEVIKGASSSASGVASPGGLVQYSTKLPRDEKFGETYLSYGSFNTKEVGLDIGNRLDKDGVWTGRLTAKRRDGANDYDYSRNDETFVMGGLSWQPSDVTKVSLVYDYLKRDAVPGSGGHPQKADIPLDRFLGEPDFNYRGTDRNTVTLLIDHAFSDALSLRSNTRYSDATTDFGYAYVAGTLDQATHMADRDFFVNEQIARGFVSDLHLQYDQSIGQIESRTLVGIEYRDTINKTKTFYGDAPAINWLNPVYTGAPSSVPALANTQTDNTTKAAYLQQELTFNENLIASFGLRHDWIDVTQTNHKTGTVTYGEYSKNSGRAALTYRLTPEVSTYASYSRSVSPPSVGTQPEGGKQLEVGVKYQPEDYNAIFSAALFDLSRTNMTVTNPITLQKEPIGKYNAKGLELEAKAEVSDNFELIASYAYLSTKIVDDGTGPNEGKEMTFSPRHTAAVWANYKLDGTDSRGDMTFGLGARFTDGYWFNLPNTIGNGSMVTFDAAMSYAVAPDLDLRVNVTNLFDRRRLAYGGFGANFYNPERAISASVTKRW